MSTPKSRFLARQESNNTWTLLDNGKEIKNFPSYVDCVYHVTNVIGVKILEGSSARSLVSSQFLPKPKQEPTKKQHSRKERKKSNGSKSNLPNINAEALITKIHTLELVKSIPLQTGTKSVYNIDKGAAFVVVSDKKSRKGRVSITIREYAIDDEEGALAKLKKKEKEEKDE